MSRVLWITLFVSCAAIPVSAQDVVHLKNGDRVTGSFTDGVLEVQVETRAGTVRIPWSRIDKIDRASYVRSMYEDRAGEVASGDASSHFLLALWCRRQGLATEMAQELKKVVEIDPDHAGARRALGFEKIDDRWLAGEDKLTAKGFVRMGSRWVLPEEAAYAEMVKERGREYSEGEAKAGDLILKAAHENPRVQKYAREALTALVWPDARIPLFRGLAERRAEVRIAAAEVLGVRRELEAVRPLLRTAILDTSAPVREAAVTALSGYGEPAILMPLARALASGREAVRTAAAHAIGGFGDVRGIQYLVSRLSQNWGPTGRNNIQVTNQVSYIRDFDVEIAQAAQIGDPIIGVLREGVILDYRVLGVNRQMTVVERRALRSALSRLAGVDMGDNSVAWSKWWDENRERLLAEAR